MTLYRDYQPALHPTALAGPYGTAWGASQGTMKDRVVTLAADAVDTGLVLRAPDDALPLLGADVALEQYPTEEADEYRARILAAWDVWPWAGTRTALELVIVQLGYENARLSTAHELGRSPWAQWWAFLTLGGDAITLRAWDAGESWGTGVWGSTADRDDVRRTRRALRRFSNARDRGWVVLLQSDPGVWGAPSVWDAGTGTWGARNPRWRI